MLNNGEICHKIYIWGTGYNARVFVKKLFLYVDSDASCFSEIWKNQIIGFIDSDERKNGKLFYDKQIYNPQQALREGMDKCIITVSNNQSIIDELRNNGFVDEQWVTWIGYLAECKRTALNNCCIDTVIEKKDVKGVSEKQTFDEWLINCNKKDLFNSDRLRSYLECYSVIDNCVNIEEKKRQLASVICKEGISLWVGAFAWRFESEVDKASCWLDGVLDNIVDNKEKSQDVKTLGLLVDRFYGGGIEKVVSLLIEGFEREGYRVVLLTEEEDGEKEYSLSETVKRVNLEYTRDYALQERLIRLEDAIRSNEVDIMCFHSGYARIESFYEVLLTKMMGIPTVMAIHSAFIALLSDQKSVSWRFQHIYRMADRIVTVSETDCFFWTNLGCKCLCIYNPIEKFDIKVRPPRENHKVANILWVGRIVQRPKQVLEVVPIMKEIKRHIKDVRLKIVGSKDSDIIYQALLNSIAKENLEDSIEIVDYHSDIEMFYKEADVILLTSASESFSNVLAEAGVYSRPVVMYELPWLPLVKDNKGIVSVEQCDTLDAAKEIINLLTDDERWEECSRDAWEKMQEYLSKDVIKDWIELFDDLKDNTKSVKESREVLSEGRETIELLLKQFYEKGYPYKSEIF